MAHLVLEGDEIVLELSPAEKLEGIHGDLRAPRSSIVSIEVLDDAHGPADFGVKAGTRVSGVIEVGTMKGLHKKAFAAVHRHTPRGVRVVFTDQGYDEWIVGCDDPEDVARRIQP